jgi:hypothetical protein
MVSAVFERINVRNNDDVVKIYLDILKELLNNINVVIIKDIETFINDT